VYSLGPHYEQRLPATHDHAPDKVVEFTTEDTEVTEVPPSERKPRTGLGVEWLSGG